MSKYDKHTSEEEKQKIIKAISDYKIGKLSQAEVCKNNNIKMHVFRWYYNAGKPKI